MTRTPDRQAATLLIAAAITAGARRAKACAVSETPCVREVVRCSTFLYFSGGRDRMMTWDIHRNVRTQW